MEQIKRYAPQGMAIFMAAIFLDSLRFKFTDHPNTQEIFGRLDGWAASFGAEGLFAHTGLFSQYVIGSAELVASVLLIAGLFSAFRHWQALGALLGVAIMTGAVSFHLFTPLGIDPNNDGAGLFIAACINLIFGVLLAFVFRRDQLFQVARGIATVLKPNATTVERTASVETRNTQEHFA